MYALTDTDIVIRQADWAFIPADPANLDYQVYLSWVEAGNTPTPYVEPPAPIPQIVTVTQGGLALIQLNLMGAVQGVIADLRTDPVTNAAVLWAWDKATEWHRDSPALNTIASLAGITPTQMDEAFALAHTIVA